MDLSDDFEALPPAKSQAELIRALAAVAQRELDEGLKGVRLDENLPTERSEVTGPGGEPIPSESPEALEAVQRIEGELKRIANIFSEDGADTPEPDGDLRDGVEGSVDVSDGSGEDKG